MVFLDFYLGLSMRKVRQQNFLKITWSLLIKCCHSWSGCSMLRERERDRILFEMRVSCKRKFAVGGWTLIVWLLILVIGFCLPCTLLFTKCMWINRGIMIEEYRRIILWRKIILTIILYNCDFQGFMG